MEYRKIRSRAAGAALALIVGLLGVGEVQAQRGGRMAGPRGGAGLAGPMSGQMGMRRGPARGVERALRLADELGLSEAQRGELDALRQQQVADQSHAAVRMLELGSEVRAGIREPEALRQEMEDLREARRDSAEGVRDQLREVLTEEQVQELQELGRPGGEGRGGFRGRGMHRGQRSFRRQQGRRRGWPEA